ncbi:MAG TPA: VOC family protein [Acidimicrobiales bacterium]|nr:VOC family protein [Acidimicrobiales bacterium]
MAEPGPLPLQSFSHLCIGVSDIDRSLEFYRRVLGFDVVFDVELDGASLDAVTGAGGSKGRMVGGLVGGVMVELLALGSTGRAAAGPHLGYTNMSFSIRDLDAAYDQVLALGVRPAQKPVDIGGVRMFFVHDPDGTPIELVGYPHGERNSAELWGRTP